MRKGILIINFIGWILVGFFAAQYYNTKAKVNKLQETVSRQGFAIEALEKQKSTYIPKYLDSIPDYD